MKKIVLIGAGSAMFGLGTLGDVFKSEVLKGSEVALVDINPDSLKVVFDVAENFVEKEGLDYRVSMTTDRTEALKGADFVIISIEIGDRYALWEMDWNLPLQFGIKQVYGENGGPGGIFHSLRIIPPILDICEDVSRICPDALLINLSNPMTNIMVAISRKYPELRCVGLCHEVSSLITHLPKILGTSHGQPCDQSGWVESFQLFARSEISGHHEKRHAGDHGERCTVFRWHRGAWSLHADREVFWFDPHHHR
ncbi:MAG: hypothetical protein ACOXZ7_01905 [Sphaerochaeta sp.]